MEIVIDTSALLAVILDEPERERIIERTVGHTLVGPGSIPWEVGNAFSALLKRNRISRGEARRGLQLFGEIPLRYVSTNMEQAITIASQERIYAYDAYLIECALRLVAPLLTLDGSLRRNATKLGVNVVEI
ncbi:MAG: type II toxin-antitoxin system VapC family toxin [Candidatus Hydrogenedentes bacterium]|nr:type II toxin-antitoxin system VapC family toxin [Candidatus Hydrogenedentota bacterium]